MTACATMAIRSASLPDAPEIGRVHVACWRETYAGLLPDDVLAKLSVPERTAMWERLLTAPPLPTKIFVGEVEGEITALGACGLQRDARLADEGFGGEISAIYVLRAQQHRGMGTALMRAMASALIGLGCTGMSLWVLRENTPARRFYEKLGGCIIGEKEERRPFGNVVEVTYGWPDLRSLNA